MLHRMALRVLPSLSLAVTESAVRKRKRLVMFVPGLLAFGVYRLAKQLLPLTEPVVLLFLTGMVGLVTAVLAYQVGRGGTWSAMMSEDGSRLLTWMAGWIGFAYGIQLSLLVLALLWLVGYDYLKHPDGPAMMAIIISCTAVARDAFEIGHVRKIALQGRPFPTFPNGESLRRMIEGHVARLLPWVLAGAVIGAVAGFIGQFAESQQAAAIVQLSAVTMLGGAIALCAYFGGLKPEASWAIELAKTKPGELLKYWWWPGLAFASTYYLVAAGAVVFVFRQPGVPAVFAGISGALVTALMALYGYYLGHRRQIEDREGQSLSPSLLRCPFVMGILGKSPNGGVPMATASTSKV